MESDKPGLMIGLKELPDQPIPGELDRPCSRLFRKSAKGLPRPPLKPIPPVRIATDTTKLRPWRYFEDKTTVVLHDDLGL